MLEWDTRPHGLEWRSSKTFIIGVVDFSVFSDLVLYGALVDFLSNDDLLTPLGACLPILVDGPSRDT